MLPGIWKISDGLTFGVRFWEDDDVAVFYSPITGDTHLVSVLALELYEMLRAKAMPEAEILENLRLHAELNEAGDLEHILHDHLLHLQRIGLLQEYPV